MIFIDKVEVVKIAAYVLGRIHGREQVDFFPVREGRENMRQHAFLDLFGGSEFFYDLFLLPDHILLFSFFPLHAADRIHLLVQGAAGPVDLLLHRFKFPDRKGGGRDGIELSFSHPDDPFQQGVELTHEFSQPQAVECQGNQEYYQGDEEDRAADAADHLLVIPHGNFPDQDPFGGC